jgi:hypothetical protein
VNVQNKIITLLLEKDDDEDTTDYLESLLKKKNKIQEEWQEAQKNETSPNTTPKSTLLEISTPSPQFSFKTKEISKETIVEIDSSDECSDAGMEIFKKALETPIHQDSVNRNYNISNYNQGSIQNNSNSSSFQNNSSSFQSNSNTSPFQNNSHVSPTTSNKTLLIPVGRNSKDKSMISDAQDWNDNNFPWTDKVEIVMKTVFGIHSFRANQREAINATLSKQDVFLLLPTGGGKSLTYQLPAMLSDGLTFVISPLISLIQDQVQILEDLDVPATMITSDNPEKIKDIYRSLGSSIQSAYKIIYCTPERFSKSTVFVDILRKLNQRGMISRFVIDEAHCVSQWVSHQISH